MTELWIQFSERLDLNEAEYKWMEEQLEYLYVYGEQEYTLETCPPELLARRADREGYRFFRSVDLADGELFKYKLVNANGERYVHIHAEDYGYPEHVGMLIQAFLRRFRPNDRWAMEYALTCSHPTPKEFGGGAVLVTADKIECRTTAEIVAEFLGETDSP